MCRRERNAAVHGAGARRAVPSLANRPSCSAVRVGIAKGIFSSGGGGVDGTENDRAEEGLAVGPFAMLRGHVGPVVFVHPPPIDTAPQGIRLGCTYFGAYKQEGCEPNRT